MNIKTQTYTLTLQDACKVGTITKDVGTSYPSYTIGEVSTETNFSPPWSYSVTWCPTTVTVNQNFGGSLTVTNSALTFASTNDFTKLGAGVDSKGGAGKVLSRTESVTITFGTTTRYEGGAVGTSDTITLNYVVYNPCAY